MFLGVGGIDEEMLSYEIWKRITEKKVPCIDMQDLKKHWPDLHLCLDTNIT